MRWIFPLYHLLQPTVQRRSTSSWTRPSPGYHRCWCSFQTWEERTWLGHRRKASSRRLGTRTLEPCRQQPTIVGQLGCPSPCRGCSFAPSCCCRSPWGWTCCILPWCRRFDRSRWLLVGQQCRNSFPRSFRRSFRWSSSCSFGCCTSCRRNRLGIFEKINPQTKLRNQLRLSLESLSRWESPEFDRIPFLLWLTSTTMCIYRSGYNPTTIWNDYSRIFLSRLLGVVQSVCVS